MTEASHPDFFRPLVAEVAIADASPSYDRLYSYAVRSAMQYPIQAGMRAAVPFGKANKRRQAMILKLHTAETAEDTQGLKPIETLLEAEPVLNEELLCLVEWLHEHTFCTWFDAVRTVLTGGMQMHLENRYRLVHPQPVVSLDSAEQAFLEHILRLPEGRKRNEFLSQAPDSPYATVLKSLVEKGCLAQLTEGRQAVGNAKRKMVRLSAQYLSGGSSYLPTPKQSKVIAVLEEQTALSVKECAYYAGVTDSVVHNLVRMGVAEEYDAELFRIPECSEPTISPEDTILSEEQQVAYDAAAENIRSEKAGAFLLYGVTGSGKTAVFEKLIALTCAIGRKVLLLIPEIALTPQIVSYFQCRFGSRVAVLHSALPLSQRLDTDKRIRLGEIDIVIGTRSAVFAPLENIGLVILDEEGEHSYKSEHSPRYHAAEVAKVRCRYHNATLLLASATPSLQSRYLAERGVYRLLTLKTRYNQAPLPSVEILDMAEEHLQGNSSSLSCTLVDALKENLEQGEQSILLLNRRGYHTLLQCARCREPIYCPNCSIPMTYHKTNDSLLCHFCGYICPAEGVTCSKCGGVQFHKMGLGTQRLEEELQNLLPNARILRMDADTTSTRGAYEKGFTAFANQEYDILCGTQMIGKGLDFPNVTLVGVISVDSALFSGSYNSYERTFSLVTQVIGRGGRGKHPGRAILQTYLPEHYVLQLAAKQDYDRFYQEEIALRKEFLLPPICDLCTIHFSCIREETARDAAFAFSDRIRAELQEHPLNQPMRLLHPAPDVYQRLGGKYRWHLMLKCKDTALTRAFLRKLLEKAQKDRAFAMVSVYADMNGEA